MDAINIGKVVTVALLAACIWMHGGLHNMRQAGLDVPQTLSAAASRPATTHHLQDEHKAPDDCQSQASLVPWCANLLV